MKKEMHFSLLQSSGLARGSIAPSMGLRIKSEGRAVLLVMTALMMSACTTSGSGKSPWRMASYDEGAPVVQYGASEGFGSSGVHTVTSGENLTSIARYYRLSPQDLIAANHLVAPYNLRPGTRLKLLPPSTYQVKAGDSLMSVARSFSVTAGNLIALNSIPAPYQLRVGQKLQLPRPVDVNTYAATLAPAPVQVATVPMWKATPAISPVHQETLAPIVEREPLQEPTVQVASLGSGMMVVPRNKPTVTPVSTHNEMVNWPPMTDSGRPFLKPLQGRVLSSYGGKSDGRYNEGVNIAAKTGAPVRAARDGKVAYVGNAVEGYGNLILIKHGDEYITAYAHLDKTLVKDGATVKRGQVIGTVGATGNVDRAQLHFEIRKGRKSIDPIGMI